MLYFMLVRIQDPPSLGHSSTLHCSTAYRLPGQPDLAEMLGFLQYRNLILAPPPHVVLQSPQGPHSDHPAFIIWHGSVLHLWTSVSFPRNNAKAFIARYRERTLIPPPQETEQAVQLPQPMCHVRWLSFSTCGWSEMSNDGPGYISRVNMY